LIFYSNIPREKKQFVKKKRQHVPCLACLEGGPEFGQMQMWRWHPAPPADRGGGSHPPQVRYQGENFLPLCEIMQENEGRKFSVSRHQVALRRCWGVPLRVKSKQSHRLWRLMVSFGGSALTTWRPPEVVVVVVVVVVVR